MIDFAKARSAMIEGQLRTSGVLDARVLSAMNAVPREEFLEGDHKTLAYLDMAHALGGKANRFMGAPAPFARLVELAEIQPSDIVLDIACGSGYSSAVIARLANSVVAVESDAELVTRANRALAKLDIGNAAVLNAPLTAGAPGEAPFDVIIIEGAVDFVPQVLFDQLREGGRLVALIGEGAGANAVLHVKGESGIASVSAFNACLPELPEFAKEPAFSL